MDRTLNYKQIKMKRELLNFNFLFKHFYAILFEKLIIDCWKAIEIVGVSNFFFLPLNLTFPV